MIKFGWDTASEDSTISYVTLKPTEMDIRRGYVEYGGRQYTFDTSDPPSHLKIPIFPQPTITGAKIDTVIIDEVVKEITDRVKQEVLQEIDELVTGGTMTQSSRAGRKSVPVRVLKSLKEKLERSEKTILREKGLHPTKNRTRTLLNYMDLFTDDEIDLIVQLVNEDRRIGQGAVHAGMVSFLTKTYVLDQVYENTKQTTGYMHGTSRREKEPNTQNVRYGKLENKLLSQINPSVRPKIDAKINSSLKNRRGLR